MQNEILLRKLIREILLNEDDGGVDVPSDTNQDVAPARVGADGRAAFSSSTSFSSGHGPAVGPFGTSGTLFGPIGQAFNTAWEQGANVAGALTNAAAKAGGISLAFKSPWTMALLGDPYIKSYMETISDGSTPEIIGKMLQTKIYQKFDIPKISAAVKLSGIPVLLSGITIAGKRLSMDPALGPAINEIGHTINSVSSQIKDINPKLKKELNSLFSYNSEYKDQGIENFIYTQIEKIKKDKNYNSPLTPNINHAINSVNNFLYENPEFKDKNKLIQTLSKSMDQRDAQNLANMIMHLKSK